MHLICLRWRLARNMSKVSVVHGRCHASKIPRGHFVLAAALLWIASPGLAQDSYPQSATDLLSATRQARNAQKFDEAEQLARQGMSRFEDSVWPLTLALVLADEGRTAEALAVLSAPWPGGLPKAERLMAEAYANERGEQVWAALMAYGEVLLIQPDNVEARDAVSRLLDRIRAPFGATAVGGGNPSRNADEAAALVRWSGTLLPTDLASRFTETDRALARLDELIATARATEPVDEAIIRRLRTDRLLALRDRFRMAEVIAEAGSITASGPPLPAYAVQALADALIYERRPEEALAAYEVVLEADPTNLRAQYGRVFALVEAERLSEAMVAADTILASQPAYAKGGANSEYAYAATLAAEIRLWANDVSEGYERLKALSEAAPANPAIRRSLVSAMNTRGWRRAADQEARIAASLQPRNLETQIMLADAALARHQHEDAKSQVDALMALVPENQRVRRLSREVAATRGWALEAELGPKWNRGGGTNASGEEWNSSVQLTTPSLGHGLRLFVLTDTSIAHPVEGRVSRNRAGGGIAFQGRDVSATLFAAESWGTLSRGHAGFTVSWEAGDRFTFGAAGETFSRQTPLRALHYGITADSLSAWAGWRRDEETAISAGIDWLNYTDGNERLSSSLVGQQRVWSSPHFDVTGRAALWYAHNSEPDVGPYFSPEWVVSGTGGLTINHIAWRRYEKSFTHSLQADLGLQDQQNFSTRWIGSLRYEHRWRSDPCTDIYYSFQIDRRVYDGDPERGIGLRLGLRQRF